MKVGNFQPIILGILTLIFTVERVPVFHQVVDKRKVDGIFDFSNEMILWNQFI